MEIRNRNSKSEYLEPVPVFAFDGSLKGLKDLNRKQGLPAKYVPGAVYVGSSKNLKDLNRDVAVTGVPRL